jgi:uncharacterized protein (DUF2267 family)
MADNHIGAVLVSGRPGMAGIVTDRDLALAVLGGELDPQTANLGDVMSEAVITCDIGADLDDVVRLMQENGVRRIPLTEGGHPVGLVTFDDLVVDGAIGIEALRGVVSAQLEVAAPHKPTGELHPKAATTPESRTRALIRAKSRAEATFGRMVAAIAEATGLDRGRAERALFVAVSMLAQRLPPDEAQHLIAQLPSILQARLTDHLQGPDRAVTKQTMSDELARSLGLAPEAGGQSLKAVCRVIAANVSAGEISEVRGALPEDMKDLFPLAA